MDFSAIVTDWPKTIAILILTALLFWGYSCQPEVTSLIYPGKKVGRAELQVELDSIISTAEFRLADLDKQEAFRDIIFNNAMLMVETGALNPVGIITMFAGLYGISRGGSDILKRARKKPNS